MTAPLKRPLSGVESCKEQVSEILSAGLFSQQRCFPYWALQAVSGLRGVYFKGRSLLPQINNSDTTCHHRKSKRGTEEPGKNTRAVASPDFIAALTVMGLIVSAFFTYTYLLFSADVQIVVLDDKCRVPRNGFTRLG